MTSLEQTIVRHPARAALQASAATAALALSLLSAPALAQQPAAAADTAGSETIVITGSRIARPDIEGAAPVTVLSNEEFRLRGAVNVEELLFDTPQIIPSLSGVTNNPGDGRAILDLRGLGANRTLILVNGRRWVSSGPSQIVDVNTIPVALIERTEVLTGGRSAVYGSDAVAGVVNFVMKKDFEGVAADASYRITNSGDGGTFDANLTLGTSLADGRGNVTMFVGYTDRQSILQGERDFSRRTISDDGAGGFFFGGSGSVPGTRYQVGRAFFDGAYPAPVVQGNNLFLPGGNTRPYVGANDAFNYAPDNYLQLPQTRFVAGAFGNFEVSDNLDVYSEVVYTNNRTVSQLASTPITGNFRISANNAFLQPGVRAAFAAIDAAQIQTLTSNGLVDAPNDGFVTISLGRRMQEVGPRISDRERQAFRVLTGVRGDIAGDWRYDLYYSYGRTTDAEAQFGNVSRSRFASAVAGCPAGAATGCVAANIFGEGAMSPASAAFVGVNTKNSNSATEQVLNGSISNGNLFTLSEGADPVGIAFGAEKRWVSGSFSPDFILASGDVVGFNAGRPTNGRYSVNEVFGEVNIPFLNNRPFFHRLEFNGAARYSDYDTATGGVFTWAAQGVWAPARDIAFRGGFQRAIRAPTIDNLFLGQSEGFPGFTDLCRQAVAASNASLRQSCISTGVPAALVGTPFGAGNSQIRAIFGGNPDTKEETADTWTAGVVLTPTFAPGLSITVDYYDISIKDAILGGGAGVTVIRDVCYGTAENGFTPFDTSFCAFLPRNPISFEVDGAISTTINAGSVKTRGVDFEIRYGIPLGFGMFGSDESRLQLRLAGTRLIQYDFNNIAAVPDLVNECAGKFGATCDDPYAKWRLNGTIGLSSGPALFNLRMNYLSAADDDGTAGTVFVDRIGSYVTFDLSTAVDINKTFNVSFGIVNLGDRKPPLLSDANNEQANTYPATYDALGRRFFVRAGVRF